LEETQNPKQTKNQKVLALNCGLDIWILGFEFI
jgi:hypothetical protein